MNFIPGLILSEMFFHDIVKPIIDEYYPDLQYSAALIGRGSEILGLDDAVSTDHHWGPRLQLFLTPADFSSHAKELKLLFSANLPPEFMGYSTNWSEPDAHKQQFLTPPVGSTINHRVELWTVSDMLNLLIGINSPEIDDLGWPSIPEQGLIEFTAGKVFHDATGELTTARIKLEYYPDNVWRFILASEWSHYAEEAAFIGRTGARGDDLGSRIVTTRIAYRLIHIAFTINKKYVPYMKWMGSMFSKLPISMKLQPVLASALQSNDWRTRERLICKACLILLQEQENLSITTGIKPRCNKYFGRDQLVVNVGDGIDALVNSITGPLKDVKYPIGTINQFIDDVHLLSDPEFSRKIISFNTI
ncbi:MAG TPA: DUF4037 domain-containing protein [Candidatus Lokiarchaeia archaeon]|nr:DUF4037 domain-containing protein [Candidatus Lokiarchaeia archaeon]